VAITDRVIVAARGSFAGFRSPNSQRTCADNRGSSFGPTWECFREVDSNEAGGARFSVVFFSRRRVDHQIERVLARRSLRLPVNFLTFGRRRFQNVAAADKRPRVLASGHELGELQRVAEVLNFVLGAVSVGKRNGTRRFERGSIRCIREAAKQAAATGGLAVPDHRNDFLRNQRETWTEQAPVVLPPAQFKTTKPTAERRKPPCEPCSPTG